MIRSSTSTFSLLILLVGTALVLCLQCVPTVVGHKKIPPSFLATSRDDSLRGGQRPPYRKLQTEDETQPSVEEASVQDEESPSDEDADGRVDLVTARSCKTEAGVSQVIHECRAETTDGDLQVEDEIDFKVEASGDKGICIHVEYEQEVEDDASTETETEAKFEVCFQQLVEYTKGNDGTNTSTKEAAYDWGVNDVVLQEFDLTTWDDFSEVSTADNGISTFQATSSDQLVMMTFTISPAGGGGTDRVTANSIKADVRIVDFPWTEGEDSYLTLMALPRAAGNGTYIVAPLLLGLVSDSDMAVSGTDCAVAGVAGLLGVCALALLGDNGSSRNGLTTKMTSYYD